MGNRFVVRVVSTAFLGIFFSLGLVAVLALGQFWQDFTGFNLARLTHRPLTAAQVGIIVNRADPLSVEIGRYYQERRQIPVANWIEITLPLTSPEIAPQAFQRIYQQVQTQTPKAVQGYALTWAAPYRVGCMSITSAFAFGYDPKFCAQGCRPTRANPYFDQPSGQPYQDFQMRPSIAIAARNLAQAKALIERGIRADGSQTQANPRGTAYLLSTSDSARNVRSRFYEAIAQVFQSHLPIQILKRDRLDNRDDVMFYFTGLAQVEGLQTNRFLPGAIADHLTSFGGALTDSTQMSALRWLEAGATGSYGTVTEPCNFPQKFPHPGLILTYYLQGETLLEAYWKSVAWPGQGIFIGEPLSRPFARPQPPWR